MQKVVSNSTVKANIAPISLVDAPDSSDQLQQLQLLMGLSLADELEEKTSRCVFVVVKRCESLSLHLQIARARQYAKCSEFFAVVDD